MRARIHWPRMARAPVSISDIFSVLPCIFIPVQRTRGLWVASPLRTIRRKLAGLSRVTFRQRRKRCAQAQSLAALGPAGLGRRAPGESIEMGPDHALGYEFFEEKRRRHRPGKAALAGIVDIGDIGLH